MVDSTFFKIFDFFEIYKKYIQILMHNIPTRFMIGLNGSGSD